MTDRRELIKKVYIDPIRSVLAIDDEFTSLDNYIAGQVKAPSGIQKDMLANFRQKKWLVDMNDGSGGSSDSISHLHQCDLLVVDYHLNRADETDNSQSLDIIKQLDKNEHFNLVVVYTSATPKEVQTTLAEILSPSKHAFGEFDYSQVTQQLEQWEEATGEQVIDELIGCLSAGDFRKLYSRPELIDTELIVMFSPLEIYLNQNEFTSYENKEILKFIFTKKMENLVAQGLFQGSSAVWTSDGDEYFSVKTSQMFVTVISKDITPDLIPSTLLSALENWYPTSNRLLLAKIRAELEANGVLFEEQILDCKYTNAGWLQQFIDDKIDGTSLTITRLFEVMSKSVQEKIREYADNLKENILIEGYKNSVVLEAKFDPEISEHKVKVNKHLNAYICSKPVSGTHIETGHILKWENSGDVEYLLCLTPICDLVPGREKGWSKKLTPIMPIKVLKLHQSLKNDANQLKEIEKKGHIVFIDGTDIKLLAVTPTGSSSTAMEIEQVFVSEQGRFIVDTDKNLICELQRIVYESPEKSDKGLHYETENCKVVGQLRYEYALNLLSQLGVDLTRIGLDFVKLA